MMDSAIFTADFREAPYWWERTPRPGGGGDGGGGDGDGNAPPGDADVVIVGSGYTGLSAAIQTAQHGRHTVVLDAEAAGWGCSSRNGGQVSTSIKPGFPLLAKKFGADAALNILREGNNALSWIEAFIRDNEIDCDYRKVGRFHAAHTAKAFDELRQKIDDIPPQLNIGAYPVAPHEQRREIGSAFYHGGVVYPHHASLDPGRYHRGLLECAQAKGVEVVSHCRVESIKKRGARFTVETSKGNITAGDVVVATSGYTGGATPWQRRRIIPIGSYMLATEALPAETIARLIPNNRVVTDTRKLVVFYRTCPERRRLLFGGRVSLNETDLRRSARLLRRQMLDIFPGLKAARITHSWMGFVGYTFDAMPHTGKHDGIFYSMGYCGSGISLASYFGMRTGLKVLNDPKGNTALDTLTFPARLYYRRNPWFLAPSICYYHWRDRRAVRRSVG